MKSLRALKAAGLIIAAVVLGLMTVQGSYALWNAVAPANAGTIQAADFKVQAGTEIMSPEQVIPLPEVTLSMTSRFAITPVSIGTAMNVTPDSPFRSTTTVTVNPVAPPLVVSVATVVDGSCPTLAEAYGPSASAVYQKADVKQTFCFRTALKDDTTNQMLGVPGTPTSATVNVAQVPFK